MYTRMISVFWILPLAAVAAAAIVRLGAVVRERRRGRMLAAMTGLRSDAPVGTGISVLCSGVTELARIEELLSEGHARYEVIVVLDARRHTELYTDLVARFRLFRMTYRPQPGLPAEGVRSMGRSRLRRFRRLVLIDRAEGDPAGDLNAAASVASYDTLLPLCGGDRLCADAVDRMVAFLASERPEPGLLRDCSGRIGLVARDAVAAAGGFAAGLHRAVPGRLRRTLHVPLFRDKPKRGSGLVRWALLLAAVWFVAAAAAGMWPLAAAASTALLLVAAEACRRRILSFLS